MSEDNRRSATKGACSIEVVQRQLDAYNRRDVEAWAATYAEDAQQFEHPDKLLASGRSQIMERVALRFRETNLHARLLNRMSMGDLVIDHEEITRMFEEGPGTIELIAIYEVTHGLISKAWFKLANKSLAASNKTSRA